MAEAHDHLNAAAKTGQAAAAELLPSLTRAYARALRAAGRRAAAAMLRTQPLAAAANPQPPGWTPPPTLSLIDQQELQQDTERRTGRLHGRMLAEAAVPALDPLGIRFDILAPTSQAILGKFASRIRETITSAIAEQVTEAVQDGWRSGASVDQVSRAIRAKVDDISKARADLYARSDLVGIANAGSLLAARVSGAAAFKRWETAGDDRVRDWHAEADGQTVPIDQPFDVDGESLDFPGDPAGSPENTWNCRCTQTYTNTAPLDASAAPRRAEPRDFGEWRDHAWEGASDESPDPREEIARVAEKLHDDLGCQNYGDTWWSAHAKKVFWSAGDWNDSDDGDTAREAFLAIKGVEKFGWDCEVGKPDGGDGADDWEQVWGPSLSAAATPGVLYLARHGLTEYDSEDHARDTIRGWADDPLDDRGVAEAHRLAENMRGLGVTNIEASDLQRAMATADIIASELAPIPQATGALRPWNLGNLQGRTSDDARDEIAAYCDRPDEAVPGGESFNDFCGRFLPAVAAAMAAAEQGARPLLVTHSHNLKLARAWIAGGRQPVSGDQFMAPSPGPASVLRFDPAEGWACEEILCDGLPLEADGFVPPEAHYRPAESASRSCGACEFFVSAGEGLGRCTMFRADVLADYVCDEFVAKSAPSAITSGGNMSGMLGERIHDGDLSSYAVSGATGLPLSERDRAWDAGQATGRVKKWASSDGSGDPDKIDYGKLARAYFWRDAPGDGGPKLGDFHLPFADIVGGKLTAVWRGVTAAAGRLGQTQGVDEGAVQKRIAAYYSAARAKYGDDSIQVPWGKKGASADGETLAAVRAVLADHGADEILGDDELRAVILAVHAANGLASQGKHAYRGDGGPCALCGMAPTNKDAHYAAAAAAGLLAAAPSGGTPWQATLCVAGEPTVDNGIKRLLDPDGGSWLPLPLPLGLLDDTPHADMTTKSPVVGRIDQIWMAGNVCQASGVFFDDSDDPKLAEQASKAAALVGEMRRMGISIDLVDTEMEMMAWTDQGARSLDYPNDPTASEMPAAVSPEAGLPTDIPEAEADEAEWEEPEYIMCFTRWVIAGATICPVQALTQATISLVAGGTPGGFRWFSLARLEQPPLTASAAGLAPERPPRGWFEVPEPDEPTPLTVTDKGQVFGHMALWDSCHTGFPGQCIAPPKSPSNYAGFHLGELATAEGGRVAVGTLTMDTGHAGRMLSAERAVAHYDNTGKAAAYVRAQDGRLGIWVAGALSARLDAADAQALMASKPSGDWREVFRGRGRDLIGVLSVNVPGFPVPRALTAAGLPTGDATVEFWTAPSDADCEREIALLAASVDGVDGLAALVET